MKFLFNTTKLIKNNYAFNFIRYRNCSNVYRHEYFVSPFCDLSIRCPFNVIVRPLDVHKYQNCDRILIKYPLNIGELGARLNCDHKNDTVTVHGDLTDKQSDITLFVEAPVKTNIYIKTTGNGNIDVARFNGDKISVDSEKGNITLEKCHNIAVSLITVGGNIICKSVIQAGNIALRTKNTGSVSTCRLQGLSLKIETENGNITTESSYCDNSVFCTKNGHLVLNNVHKNCKICVQNTVGFDGTLEAYLTAGNHDLQIERILQNSKVIVKKNGNLELKLSEDCVSHTLFEVDAKSYMVDDGVALSESSVGNKLKLTPKNEVASANFQVDCKEGNVHIQSASWIDMFKLGFKVQT